MNRQIFTGQEHDGNTGLIYFGARYYDPETARFLTQDAYLGEQGTPPSLHRYLYAYSNPTVYVDLFGYRTATPEEEAQLKLWQKSAAKYKTAYENQGTLGKVWDRGWAGNDYLRWHVLENHVERAKTAIAEAADGEPVMCVPDFDYTIEVTLSNGKTETIYKHPEYLTESTVKWNEQLSDLEAAENGVVTSLFFGAGASHETIQIVSAAENVLMNTAIAAHSRASNPSVRMTVERRDSSKIVYNIKTKNRLSKAERKALKKEYLESLPDVMKKNVMAELRTKNTRQAQHSYRLYNSDVELNMELDIQTPFGPVKGQASDYPYRKTWVSIYDTRNAHDTAGVAAHEVRHIMQKINKRLPSGGIDPKHRKSFRHEIEAYRWQRDAGFLNSKHWTDRRIYLHVRGHKYYQDLYKEMLKQHGGKAPPWTSWFD